MRTRNSLISIFFSFGAVQAAQMLLPLLALPVLARALGAEFFGLLMYMGIISTVVGLVMDWGFAQGAVRWVARSRASTRMHSHALAGVLSAKLLLAVICALCSFFFLPWLPHANAYPGACALAVLGGLVRGINPTWYFQGLGQGMRAMAFWEVTSSALVLLLSVAFITEPAHWTRYLLLLAMCKGPVYIGKNIQIALHSKGLAFSLRHAWKTLIGTRVFFGSVLAALIYCNGAQLVLGHFLSPALMGQILSADKIVRAIASLSSPATSTLFPEICALKGKADARAVEMLRLSLLGNLGAMLCAACLVWLAAPWIVRAALGVDYADTVPVLRVMIWFAPLLACNMVLGTQALLPCGREKYLLGVQSVLAAISMPLAVLLARSGGIMGAACLTTVIEGAIAVGLLHGVWRYCPGVIPCTGRRVK